MGLRPLISSILLFLASTVCAQETVYHWSSDDGIVIETGGTIVQHNATMLSRINNECGEYYVITLLGRGENINLEDDSQYSQYMEIGLSAGNTFKTGDIITITGMRNCTNLSANATLFMQFSNGATIKDDHVWNNLGELYEVTVEADTSSGAKRAGEGNEDFNRVSAFPSTYSFEVPAEADGCTSLRLSRDIYQCRLYLVEIDVTRERDTALDVIKLPLETSINTFDLHGRATKAQHGIIITNGRKFIMK